MNILVTGGCGYVGTVLVPELLNQGHNVTVFDTMWFGNFLQKHANLKVIEGDIRNIDSIPLDNTEVVIHLANIANDPCGELNAKLSWEVNVLSSMQLIEKAIASKVKQFIYASSGSVYGVKEEEHVVEELSLVPISDYNKTKMIAERVFLSYQDKIKLQIVRPATVCGYSDRMRLDVSVNMLTMQALKNNKITVFGGDQVRPNIHVLDMVRVYLHFISTGRDFTGVFNAGFENISIMDIANMVKRKLDTEIVVTPSNDPRSYRLNSDKLLKTGFKKMYSVEYAIDEIIEKFNAKKLDDQDDWYNLKMMKKLHVL